MMATPSRRFISGSLSTSIVEDGAAGRREALWHLVALGADDCDAAELLDRRDLLVAMDCRDCLC